MCKERWQALKLYLRLIGSVLTFTILYFALFLSYVDIHEQIHVEVFRQYGVDSEVNWFEVDGAFGFGFSTSPNITQFYDLPETERRDLQFLQAQAEIVGYNFAIFPLMGALFATLFIWIRR